MNYLAIVVAAIVSFILGGIRYSPIGFAKSWMKYMHITIEDHKNVNKNDMVIGYVMTLVLALIMVCVLARLFNEFSIDSYVAAFTITALVRFGFVFSTQLMNNLRDKRSVNIVWINVFYYLISMVASAAILIAMK